MPTSEHLSRHSGAFRSARARGRVRSSAGSTDLSSLPLRERGRSTAGGTLTGWAGSPELQPSTGRWLAPVCPLITQRRNLDIPERTGLQNSLFLPILFQKKSGFEDGRQGRLPRLSGYWTVTRLSGYWTVTRPWSSFRRRECSFPANPVVICLSPDTENKTLAELLNPATTGGIG